MHEIYSENHNVSITKVFLLITSWVSRRYRKTYVQNWKKSSTYMWDLGTDRQRVRQGDENTWSPWDFLRWYQYVKHVLTVLLPQTLGSHPTSTHKTHHQVLPLLCSFQTCWRMLSHPQWWGKKSLKKINFLFFLPSYI